MAATTKGRWRESAPKPKNDAYTGLLLIALLAMITSCALLYFDFDSYGKTPPPKVQLPAPGSSTATPVPTSNPDGGAAAPMGDTPMTPPPEPPKP